MTQDSHARAASTETAPDAATALDGMGSTTEALEQDINYLGKMFISTLDKAVGIQSSTVITYVNALRRRHPEDSPEQLQERLNRHFLRLATSSGASVGAAAAIPGIGFATGSAAVAGESLVFLDLATLYTAASGHLRGIDIKDQERRRSLVLVSLLGAKGNALVEAIVGDLSQQSGHSVSATARALTTLSGPTLAPINNQLTKFAVKRFTKRLMRSWLGKILPLGIGAIAGTIANRKLAHLLIDNVSEYLGHPPQDFPTPLPVAATSSTKDQADQSAHTTQQSWWRKPLTAATRLLPRRGKDADGGGEENDELDTLALSALASVPHGHDSAADEQ